VRRLFQEHREGRANHGRLLYALAMFSCWWKEQLNLAPLAPTRKLRVNA
jgi:hypothetical protein